MDDKSGFFQHFGRDKLSVLPPLGMIDITTLEASTACYRDSFTLWRRSVLPVGYELDCKYCYK
jgi:hypothetical protein